MQLHFFFDDHVPSQMYINTICLMLLLPLFFIRGYIWVDQGYLLRQHFGTHRCAGLGRRAQLRLRQVQGCGLRMSRRSSVLRASGLQDQAIVVTGRRLH